MNREIKYRVWDKRTKQMLYPHGIAFYNNGTEIKCLFSDCIGCMSNDDDVMQFTGLLDKQGKEIYEGDILSYNDTVNRRYTNGEVIWSKEYLTYLVKFHYGTDYMSEYLCHFQNLGLEIEVIGNIFENPELLNNNRGV